MLSNLLILVFLMGLAILLILLEIFLLPGITLAGIGGFLFAAGGIFFAYSLGTATGHLTLGISLLLFAVVFAWLLRSRSFHRVALNTDIDSTIASVKDTGIRPGDEGITLSRLAPVGKARIGHVVVEARAREELIDENTPIVVTQVDNQHIFVERQEKTSIHV